MIADPPLLGALQDSVIDWFPCVAVKFKATEGIVDGVADAVADSGDSPIAFVAVTVNE